MAHDSHSKVNHNIVAEVKEEIDSGKYSGKGSRVSLPVLADSKANIEQLLKKKPLPAISPLTAAEVEAKLLKADVFFELASNQITRGGQARDTTKKERDAFRALVSQLIDVRRGVAALAQLRHVNSDALKVSFSGTPSAVRSQAYALNAWLADNSAALGDIPAMAEWKKVMTEILAQLSPLASTLQAMRNTEETNRSIETQAHAACEQTVRELVNVLRVAFWNDGAALKLLRLAIDRKPAPKKPAEEAPATTSEQPTATTTTTAAAATEHAPG